MTFKSQHGRTYHIRTVHSRSLNRQINVQRNQYEGNNNYWEDQEYGDQSMDSPDDTCSTYSMGSSSVSSVNDLGPAGQRNEHPHLTGMWALYAMSIHWANHWATNAQHFPVTRMAIPYHWALCHHRERQHHKGTGAPLIVRCNSALLIFSTGMQSSLPWILIHFLSYGLVLWMVWMPLPHSGLTRKCT